MKPQILRCQFGTSNFKVAKCDLKKTSKKTEIKNERKHERNDNKKSYDKEEIMQKVKVEIEGIAPLLMNRFVMENPDEEKGAKRRDKQYDIKEDTEKALYKDKKIGCYAPSAWIEACLRETAKQFKGKGRSSLKATILSSVFVDSEKIPLNKDTYDAIDVRPVVIQRNRVVKGRPRFDSWKLKFVLNFNEERIKKETLKDILEEAGATKGIGDYRPKFGRFKLVKFG